MHQDDNQEHDVASRHGHIGWRRLLQRRLLVRVTIPTLIGLVQLAFAIVAIVAGRAPAIVLWWALPALLVGYLFGRQTKIAWDDESAQVSLIGAQLLLTVAYIGMRVGTHIALEKVLSGRVGLADGLLLVSFGLFFGRSVALAAEIWHALAGRSGQREANSGRA